MSHELGLIREAMLEVERLEAALEEAKERRTQLATSMYEQHGPRRTYTLADEHGATRELLVSRTKPRKDGTVSYFFAEKQRWRGPRVALDIETASVEPSATAPILTGRIVEATANLTGRSEAGDEPGLLPITLDERVPKGELWMAVARPEPVLTEADFKPRRVTGPHAGRFLDELCCDCGEPQFSTPSGVTCPNGHGGAPSLAETPEALRSLSPEELALVPVPSPAEIEAAMEDGRVAAEASRSTRGGVRLPIARQAAPEPRLLQIKEPELDDDPEGDAVLDDILASLDGL